MRLQGRRWSDVDEPALPEFHGYKLKGLVQFHSQKKHFRCVRFSGNSTVVLDGENVTEYVVREDIWQTIHESGWQPYIVAYSLKDAGKTAEYIQMAFDCGRYSSLGWELPQVCLVGGSGGDQKDERPTTRQLKTQEFISENRRLQIEEIKETCRLRLQIFNITCSLASLFHEFS